VIAVSTITLPPAEVLQLPARRPKRPRLPIVGQAPQGLGGVINDTAPNPYPTGECTWGVWQLVWDGWGVAMPDFPGNATDWGEGLTRWGAQQMPGPTVNAIVVWSSSKYPPFGHVALVVAVNTDGSFTVKEMNFQAWNTWDVRLVRPGADQEGIEGFWLPKGVPAGQTAGTVQGFSAPDPWSELTGGIAQAEQAAEAQISNLGRKLAAGGEIVLGLGGLGLGTAITVLALRNPEQAQRVVTALPRRLAGRARRQALPAAQRAVLGPAPAARRVTAAARARMLPG
jgi:surface antigen